MPKQYEDFKYIMQDLHTVYVGANYTIEELIEEEDTPFKLRLILEKYLYDETTKTLPLSEYFLQLQDKTLYYKVFKQLKTKLKVVTKDSGTNTQKPPTYKINVMTVDALMKQSTLETGDQNLIIQEVSFNKLAMMTF